MKLRNIFLIIFLIVSAVLFFVLFTENIIFTGNIVFYRFLSIFKNDTFRLIYYLAAFCILPLGLEEENKSEGKIGIKILYFLIAFTIAFLTYLYIIKSKLILSSFEPYMIFSLATPLFLVFYQTLFLICKKFFNHSFELASKFDLIKRPIDWVLTMLIFGLSFGLAFFIAQIEWV